ncbi:thymidylate synthase [Clostridia bacterium]|nr:thymidylate synthase [Clostridia bacterium]
MNIIKPGFEILDELNGAAILAKIEKCGRVCYKSEGKIVPPGNDGSGSAARFVSSIIARGHESVLEHFSFSVRFVADRGVSHEIVRHRIASFSQESTRYCNYATGDVTFIEPLFFAPGTESYAEWEKLCSRAEETYLSMLRSGVTPEKARSVLPNSLKTELIMTANLREWRHFLKLRTDKSAHPQMREVAVPLLSELKEKIPVIFDDISG